MIFYSIDIHSIKYYMLATCSALFLFYVCATISLYMLCLPAHLLLYIYALLPLFVSVDSV